MATAQDTYGKPTHAQAFNVPEGYFEHLTQRILDRTVNEEGEVKIIKTIHRLPTSDTRHRRISMRRLIAAAAAVAGFIITLGLHTAQKPQNIGSAANSTQLAETTSDNNIDNMIDYVMYDDDDFYAYLIDN